ncbi:MAG: porin [Pirellulales bacterium]
MRKTLHSLAQRLLAARGSASKILAKRFKSAAAVAALALALGVSTPALSQDSTSQEIADLKARLEQLERQNAEFKALVLERLPQDSPSPSDLQVNASRLDTAEIHSILDAYLAEQEAKKSAEAEAARAAGHEVGSDLSMTATWKDGLELATKNKDFRVHIGGRTQFDTAWFSADPNLYTQVGPIQSPTPGLTDVYADGVDFRRARLRVDGTMYEQIEWAAEYDFVNSAGISGTARAFTAPTDLWWAFKEVPILQTVKIGNQKEAIGFEHMVSSRYLPFMERSYNQDAFYGGLFNGFSPGITTLGTYGEEDIGTYNVGIFKPPNTVFGFNTGDGDYAVVGRLTRLLWWEDEGSQLVHMGLSLRQGTAVATNVGAGSSTPFRTITYRTRDAIRSGLSTNWPTPANITLFGDDTQSANFEFVVVNGSFTLQAEYLVNGLQDARTTALGPLGTTVTYHGGYVQMMYFLTGEHDHYGKKVGFFERVRPNENFFLVRDESGCRCFGRGAWQVGARYNYLDLNDEGLNGGILHNGTFGVNWFLNPNMKVQFNYMATYRDAPLPGNTGDGWVNGWGIRVAHDF